MILTEDDVKKIIQKGTPDWIKKAKKHTKTLQTHINGVDVAGHLNKIERYENSAQLDLRKRFATSNKFTYANILRPVDKVFSAKGGSKMYRTKTEPQKEGLIRHLDNVAEGMYITQWIQNVQLNKLISDPNGFVFFEWDKEVIPTMKSVMVVYNYQTNGRYLDWVVFEPEKRNDEEGKPIEGEFFRVVDQQSDRTYRWLNERLTLIDEYTNPWERVPAILNSPIMNYDLMRKDSPVENSIELAEHYLRTTSVKNIYEFLHGYPIYWEYSHACKLCEGTGIMDNQPCHSCSGTGRVLHKDVSDGLKLKIPQEGEPKLAPDVAGYVQPDLNTWEQQRTELDWLYTLMYYTEWGTTQEKETNETATGRFIDTQSVNDRLNQYADMIEDTERLMTDFIGQFYYQSSYEGSSIIYGRRYMIEPPDTIWKKYQSARTAGAPQTTLDYLLLQYYQAEFANDMENMTVSAKSMKLEPFIHYSIERVMAMNVTEEVKKRKTYFPEWYKTLSIEELLGLSIQELNTKFNEYLINYETSEAPREG